MTEESSGRAGWRPSVGHVALLLPLVAVVIAARLPIRDNSYLWHIVAGRLQIDRGSVLTSDPFSFASFGQPWRTQSWLADLAYGWSEGIAPLVSAPWTIVLSAVVLLGAVALRAHRHTRAVLATAVVTLWVMWLTLGFFTARPVLPSLALLAVFLVAADDKRLRWALPVVVWIWASIHGGFVVGLAYLALRTLRDRAWRQGAVDLMACAVAASVTAHGWGTWEVLVRFAGSQPALGTIVEWLPPDLTGAAYAPFLGVILALLAAGIAGRIAPREVWVLAPVLAFAFTANRAVPLATLIMVPWLAVAVRGLSGAGSGGSRVANGLAAALVVVIPLVLPIEGGLDAERFPLEAAAMLSEDKVFHDDAVGGYLIYRDHPDRLVYIDDRAELHGQEYIDFSDARAAEPVWSEVFTRYGFSEALVRPDDPIRQVLEARGWEEVHGDPDFVVLRPG